MSSAKRAVQQSMQPMRAKIREVMHDFKYGKLKGADGTPITDRKEAIAIALNSARDPKDE